MGECEALSSSFWLDPSTCTRDRMGKEGFYLVAYGLVPLVKELGFYSADSIPWEIVHGHQSIETWAQLCGELAVRMG